MPREYARKIYVRWIRPRIAREISRQRIKILWVGWGYLHLLSIGDLPLLTRLDLLRRFLRVDWHVVHAHKPAELSAVCRVLAERKAASGEVVVEAGCWKGGSSAKLSILCAMLGYELWMFDSFEGVEPMAREDLSVGEYDFSGEYAASEAEVRSNLARFGAPEVCAIHQGWFSETLGQSAVDRPVRAAYIDCDLAKGTLEVLRGIVPTLVEDGCIFSQDFHIDPVREVVMSEATWRELGVERPDIDLVCHHLAAIRLRRSEA